VVVIPFRLELTQPSPECMAQLPGVRSLQRRGWALCPRMRGEIVGEDPPVAVGDGRTSWETSEYQQMKDCCASDELKVFFCPQCLTTTSPPRCAEGRQMTRVPNMPGIFSVLG